VKNLISILFLSLLLISCGQDAKRTETKLLLNLGLLTNPGSFEQGLVIMARRLDDTESFQIPVYGNEINLSLSNGAWEFAAIAWKDGVANKLFTGKNVCFYSDVVYIKPPAVNLNFKLADTQCDFITSGGSKLSQYFANVGTKQFPILKIQACEDIDGIPFGSPCSNNAAAGGTGSIEITVHGNMKTTRFGSITLPSYRECLPYVGNYIDTFMRIPYGEEDGSIFDLDISLFSTNNCSGPSVRYDFSGGLMDDDHQGNLASEFNHINLSDYQYLKLEKNAGTTDVILPLIVTSNFTAGILNFQCNRNGVLLTISYTNLTNTRVFSSNNVCNIAAGSAVIDMTASGLDASNGHNIRIDYTATEGGDTVTGSSIQVYNSVAI
jgi:hypothetical protein